MDTPVPITKTKPNPITNPNRNFNNPTNRNNAPVFSFTLQINYRMFINELTLNAPPETDSDREHGRHFGHPCSRAVDTRVYPANRDDTDDTDTPINGEHVHWRVE